MDGTNFLLSKMYCLDFFINLTYTSFEGLSISLITHMNQSVVSEKTVTQSPKE